MTNEELQTLIKNACKAAGWRVKKTLHASVVSVWIDGAPYVVKLADDDGDSRALQVACKIALAFAQTEDGKWCAEAYSPLDEKAEAVTQRARRAKTMTAKPPAWPFCAAPG